SWWSCTSVAVFDMPRPADETSRPAPSTVLHAPSEMTASARTARAGVVMAILVMRALHEKWPGGGAERRARRGLHPRMNARKTMLELAFEFKKGLDLEISQSQVTTFI